MKQKTDTERIEALAEMLSPGFDSGKWFRLRLDSFIDELESASEEIDCTKMTNIDWFREVIDRIIDGETI